MAKILAQPRKNFGPGEVPAPPQAVALTLLPAWVHALPARGQECPRDMRPCLFTGLYATTHPIKP